MYDLFLYRKHDKLDVLWNIAMESLSNTTFIPQNQTQRELATLPPDYLKITLLALMFISATVLFAGICAYFNIGALTSLSNPCAIGMMIGGSSTFIISTLIQTLRSLQHAGFIRKQGTPHHYQNVEKLIESEPLTFDQKKKVRESLHENSFCSVSISKFGIPFVLYIYRDGGDTIATCFSIRHTQERNASHRNTTWFSHILNDCGHIQLNGQRINRQEYLQSLTK